MFYRDERLALFIDGANLYAAARALGFDIDYKLLRTEFMRRGKLLRAFYYTALLETEEYSPIRPLVESLQRQGVRVSVVSTIRSSPPMIADELRRQCDNFIELDELREVIGRPPRGEQVQNVVTADEDD